jgi:hypothetical protein
VSRSSSLFTSLQPAGAATSAVPIVKCCCAEAVPARPTAAAIVERRRFITVSLANNVIRPKTLGADDRALADKSQKDAPGQFLEINRNCLPPPTSKRIGRIWNRSRSGFRRMRLVAQCFPVRRSLKGEGGSLRYREQRGLKFRATGGDWKIGIDGGGADWTLNRFSSALPVSSHVN